MWPPVTRGGRCKTIMKFVRRNLWMATHKLSPWLMEPWGSMPYSQGISNKPYSEHNQPNSSYWFLFFTIHSNIILSLRLDLPKCRNIFQVGITVKILKALLSDSTLATWSVPLNLLDLITLIILGERYKLTNSMAYGTRRFNAAFTRAFQ